MTERELIKQVENKLWSFEDHYQEHPHDVEFLEAMGVIEECLDIIWDYRELLNQDSGKDSV